MRYDVCIQNLNLKDTVLPVDLYKGGNAHFVKKTLDPVFASRSNFTGFYIISRLDLVRKSPLGQKVVGFDVCIQQ